MDKAESGRRSALSDAGYNPDNHPRWATVEWLQAKKAEAHKEHQRVIDQYRPARETSAAK